MMSKIVDEIFISLLPHLVVWIFILYNITGVTTFDNELLYLFPAYQCLHLETQQDWDRLLLYSAVFEITNGWTRHPGAVWDMASEW
jgi:hypothetical protein